MIKNIILLAISLVLFIFAVFLLPVSAAAITAESAVEYAEMADVGFSLLEKILLVTVPSGGGLALVLLRVARQGTKTLLKSLDSNPYVDNRRLLTHAKAEGDKKAEKLIRKIT